MDDDRTPLLQGTLAWTTDSQALIYAHQKALRLWRLNESHSVQLTVPPFQPNVWTDLRRLALRERQQVT